MAQVLVSISLKMAQVYVSIYNMTAENIHNQARAISSDLLRIEMQAIEAEAVKTKAKLEGSMQQ